MRHRYTLDVISSGQVRPYAPTHYQMRLTLECSHWTDMTAISRSTDDPLKPWYVTESAAREILRSIPASGFCETTSEDAGPWDRRLVWLEPRDERTAADVIPGGDPAQRLASVWEFRTETPSTD